MYKLKYIILAIFFINSVCLANPRFGNRYFVANVLMDIFGPDSQEIINTEILSKPMIFGGACSIMTSTDRMSNDWIDACPRGLVDSKIGPFSNEKLQRMSIVEKTCLRLVQKESTLNFVYNKKNTDVNNIIKLFYPVRNLTTEQVRNAKKILTEKRDPKINFQELIYALCISEEWQIP